MGIGIAIVVIVILIGLYIMGTYNGLVGARNILKEAFSTMDVYLKKRWDLIPNLVETVKGYAKHEQETLNQITAMRTDSYDKMSMNEKIEANKELSKGIASIMAVAENYPDLKANSNFMQLSSELTKVEEDIANSRKYYNGSARTFNNKVEMFPSNIVAGMFHFKEAEMFEASEEERNNVKVQF